MFEIKDVYSIIRKTVFCFLCPVTQRYQYGTISVSYTCTCRNTTPAEDGDHRKNTHTFFCKNLHTIERPFIILHPPSHQLNNKWFLNIHGDLKLFTACRHYNSNKKKSYANEIVCL